MRHVVAGFAGPHARTATLKTASGRLTQRLGPAENGAYLFVLRAAATTRPKLTITDDRGATCSPLDGRPCT